MIGVVYVVVVGVDRIQQALVVCGCFNVGMNIARCVRVCPSGHVVTITKDDLPSEDEDEAETAGDMGDFAASIGGADKLLTSMPSVFCEELSCASSRRGAGS